MTSATNVVVKVAQLRSLLEERPSLYVGWSGFEERSVSALRSVGDLENVWAIRFFNDPDEYEDVSFHGEFKEILGARLLDSVGINRGNQFGVQSAFSRAAHVAIDRGIRLVIDISAMPRDVILIGISAIGRVKETSTLETLILYNFAEDYDHNQKDNSKKWLSKGVTEISSVLGYSGKIVPGRATTLIALVGFDSDRLVKVVERLGVDKVVIGLGMAGTDGKKWIETENRRFAQALKAGVIIDHEFEFDCDNLTSTIEKILCEVDQSPNENKVIFPANNKISTLAAGAVCLRRPHVQICYAPALIYNADGHVLGSDRFWVSKDFPFEVGNAR